MYEQQQRRNAYIFSIGEEAYEKEQAQKRIEYEEQYREWVEGLIEKYGNRIIWRNN